MIISTLNLPYINLKPLLGSPKSFEKGPPNSWKQPNTIHTIPYHAKVYNTIPCLLDHLLPLRGDPVQQRRDVLAQRLLEVRQRPGATGNAYSARVYTFLHIYICMYVYTIYMYYILLCMYL